MSALSNRFWAAKDVIQLVVQLNNAPLVALYCKKVLGQDNLERFDKTKDSWITSYVTMDMLEELLDYSQTKYYVYIPIEEWPLYHLEIMGQL